MSFFFISDIWRDFCIDFIFLNDFFITKKGFRSFDYKKNLIVDVLYYILAIVPSVARDFYSK